MQMLLYLDVAHISLDLYQFGSANWGKERPEQGTIISGAAK
jgi:hypothetical protein